MRIRAAAFGLLVAAVVIAGCGGSSNSSGSSSPSATSTVATPSTSSSAPTTGSSTTTPTTTTSSGTPSFASAKNCLQLAGVGQKFAQALAATNSNGSLDLQAAVNAYKALADAAPSAIRPDLELMSEAFASFASALQKAGYKPGTVPTAAQTAAVEAAVQQFNQSRFQAAAQRISAWASQNCS